MITNETERLGLWAEGVPDGQTGRGPAYCSDDAAGHWINVHEPALLHYVPEKPNGAAMVICPGGGYEILSMRNEGELTAQWLAGLGFHAFVLMYRLKDYKFPAQLRDVTRAMRLVRSRAADWGVAADRIGLMGFSAGGHLASMGATMFDAPEARTGAALDAVSARPDFAVLIYPVITLGEPSVHTGSRRNLGGDPISAELIERLSTERRVTKATPPTFLLHCGSDLVVPVENSLMFYSALRAAGVPAELHIHEAGGHGFGMRKATTAVAGWPKLVETWLRELGVAS